MRVNKSERAIRELLSKMRVEHRLESGTKHIKIFVNNNLVGIIGRGRGLDENCQATRNVISQIKNAAKHNEARQGRI